MVPVAMNGAGEFHRSERNAWLAAYREKPRKRETAMKTAKIISAGIAASVIMSSAALAQQTPTVQPQNPAAQQSPAGMITEVNRLNGSVAIRQIQNGTVGASASGATERFKVQGISLDDFHAGDKVTYTASDTGGTRTITKLQKQ
jgi:Cu/Ag efflux protein CusF